MAVIIDAAGKACPLPVVLAKKAIAALEQPEEVQVIVDNTTAVQNLTRLADSLGAQALTHQDSEERFTVSITPGAGTIDKAAGRNDACQIMGQAGPTVYAVGSNKMGRGNDELGGVLMKSFIYSLCQLGDKIPDTVIFFNSGAYLTAEDSPCLEDLKALAEAGTDIITCGTCADFLKTKEHLGVGRISNMYEIVETMNNAGKVVRI